MKNEDYSKILDVNLKVSVRNLKLKHHHSHAFLYTIDQNTRLFYFSLNQSFLLGQDVFYTRYITKLEAN